jgi:hypothetical protein
MTLVMLAQWDRDRISWSQYDIGHVGSSGILVVNVAECVYAVVWKNVS